LFRKPIILAGGERQKYLDLKSTRLLFTGRMPQSAKLPVLNLLTGQKVSK